MAEDSSLDSWKLRRQEYYRKFYTDLNDMRIEMGLPPKKYHLDLLEDEVFTRTIFIKIHNGFYAVSCKELNQVFSRFGVLDDVVQFNRGHGFHSKICFNNNESTMRAFKFLNGRNIYDDCCTMELFLVVDCVDGQTKGDIVAESPNQDQVTLNSPPRSSSMEESAVLQISPSLDINDRYSIECARGQFDSCVEEEIDGASSKWWPSTNQTMSESQHEKQTSASAPSLLGVEFNLEANSETQDRGELCSLPEDQEIVELRAIECSDFRGGPTYYPTLVEELKEPDPSSGLVELSASEPSCYPLKFSELQSINPCDPLVLNLDQYPAKVKVKLDPLVTDFASDGSTKMRDSVDLSIDHFVSMDECNSFSDVIIDAAPKGMGDMIKMTINWIEFDMDDLGTNSGAHKVFDKLSEHDVFRLESNLISHNVESSIVMDLVVAKHRLWAENVVFDPGIVDRHEFIHGDFTVSILVLIGTEINVGVLLSLNHSNWVFDPGVLLPCLLVDRNGCRMESRLPGRLKLLTKGCNGVLEGFVLI